LRGFPCWSSRSSNHRRPRKLYICGSSSYELQSSYRVLRSQPATRRFRLSSSFLEVSCLIAPSTSQVRSPRWVPRHRRLPSSGFCNLPTACSPLRLAGLFHPASTSRLLPSGSFPRQEPFRLFAETLPSCGYRECSSPCEVKTPEAPLQGLAPLESPLRSSDG